MEPLLGEIRPFGYNFAPLGWQKCNGQLLAISQYAALFSILGTSYGGNGTTNFALPNIQGSVFNGIGTLPGGDTYVLGEVAGTTSVIVLSPEMPSHNHSLNGATSNTAPETSAPAAGSYIGNSYGKANPTVPGSTPGKTYAPVGGVPKVNLNLATIGLNGGNQPHNNMAPYLAINYCIAIVGNFPARN
jgi:microcystin-dependent protein